MPAVEFFAPSGADKDALWANSARLVNWYRERSDGRNILKQVLGTEAWGDIGGRTFVRAAENLNRRLIVAQGGQLFKFLGDGTNIGIGTMNDSPETTISANNGKVTVVAGGDYYVRVEEALTNPESGAFSNFGSVMFFAQLTVLTERQGRRVQWSNVADPLTLDGLNYATTEARDDLNIRALPIGGSLWIFKERSIERWYQDGTGLRAIPGATIDRGLKEFNLLTGFPSGAFFIGDDGKAYVAAGDQMQPVSNPPVETSIKQDNPDRVTYYQDEGHEFCVIHFASRPAWVFDLTTQEWHERAEGDGKAWTVKVCAYAFGYWVGCTDDGQQLRLVRNSTDVSGPLISRAVGRTMENEGKRFKIPRFSMRGRVGFANVDSTLEQREPVLGLGGDDVLDVGDDEPLLLEDVIDPRRFAHLRFCVSKDSGHTWSQPRFLSLGYRGETDKVISVRALGQFRQFTPEIRYSDPFDLTLDASAALDAA